MVGIIIDIFAIIVIGIAAFTAYKQGFVKTFFGFLSTVVAIILACILYKGTAAYLKDNTQIDEWLGQNVVKIGANAGKQANTAPNIDTTSALNNMPNAITQLIDFDEIKKNATDVISTNLVNAIMNILSWIIVYVLARIALLIVVGILNGIMSLPLLKEINNIAGLVLGIIMGFFRIYLILAIIYFIANITNMSAILNAINASTMVSGMYYNNLLINLIF